VAGGLDTDDFARVSVNGFGDPQNSYAFSMAWYRDRLFVGTVRNMLALVNAAPPKHPAGMKPWPVPVPGDVFDLDLRAQLWSYEPGGDWEQVFRAPLLDGEEEPAPREIGYRDMAVVPAHDGGADELFVATASSNSRGPGALVLRYSPESGVRLVAPAGLGDQNVSTIRTLLEFRGSLFLAPTGSGRAWNASSAPAVFECTDPDRGQWEPVSDPAFGDPTNEAVYTMCEFDGKLYAGTINPTRGYQVWKTAADTKRPYQWEPVLVDGAGRGNLNEAAMTMEVLDDALYVGSGISNGGFNRTHLIGPAAGEVIRLYPDDTWDIVVGTPRRTSDGRKWPVGGMDAGFDNPMTGYIWSMAAHDGQLYVGTFDSTIFALWADRRRQPEEMRRWLRKVGVDRLVEDRAGFELWRSPDGEQWTPVTRNGFGNPYNYGARTLASTPAGLFVGTANPFGPKVATRTARRWTYTPNPDGGLEVWLGSPDGRDEVDDPVRPRRSESRRSRPGPMEERAMPLPRVQPARSDDGARRRRPAASVERPGPRAGRRQLLAELQRAEAAWRAAARAATEASHRYHRVRALGALARRALVDESSQQRPPAWAVAMRQWEGVLGEGAAKEAGIECIRASRVFHLASAHRDRLLWELAEDEADADAALTRYQQHVDGFVRASRRLRRVGQDASLGPRR
jgi:hypothetical protein